MGYIYIYPRPPLIPPTPRAALLDSRELLNISAAIGNIALVPTLALILCGACIAFSISLLFVLGLIIEELAEFVS